MTEASGPNRRIVTLVALITVLATGGIAIFIMLRGGSQSEVNAHRGQWAEQSINAYEMELRRDDSLETCQIRYQVRNDMIVSSTGTLTTAGNACTMYTVSELFDLIENTSGCGPNGCACDGPIGTDVTYDAALGYPTRIETRLFPSKRYLYPEFWKKQVLGGGCTLVGYVGMTIEVLSLTPLP